MNRMGWEDARKDLREMGTSWESVKREALKGLGWKRSTRSCVQIYQRRICEILSQILQVSVWKDSLYFPTSRAVDFVIVAFKSVPSLNQKF
jgi:hypothetical protein